MIDWLARLRGGKAASGVPAPQTPLAMLRYVVVDTELTSLDVRTNRVLAIGAVRMEGSRIRVGEPFYRIVNPEVAVPEPGIKIHHLTPGDVAGGIPPADALAQLLDFMEGGVLIGHFIGIDLAALRKELRLAGMGLPSNPALDTVQIHRWLDLRRKLFTTGWDHQVTSLDLATVAPLYHVEASSVHHALDDAFVAARLWQRQIYALQAAGITTLSAALRVGRG